MKKLTTQQFAEYLAGAWFLLEVELVLLDQLFHQRFVMIYRDVVKNLPAEHVPAFEISLNESDDLCDAVKVIMNQLVFSHKLAYFVNSSQIHLNRTEKSRALKRLFELPQEVRKFFFLIAYNTVEHMAT